MKMDSLRLYAGADTFVIPLLSETEPGPFALKSVEGLGPSEVTVRATRNVKDLATYQGRSAALKQLIVLVALQPNWDEGERPDELRTKLYSLLTPRYGSLVRIEVMYNGFVQAFTEGQVSKFEAAIFTKEPAVQITFDCMSSYFRAPAPEITTPAQRSLGGIRAFDITNPGTAPSGFSMGVILRANVASPLVLKDAHPQGQRIQIEGINWVAGDRLVVNTIPGERGVWRGKNGGNLASVLGDMDTSVSEWMTLYEGVNTLTLNTTAFDWDPEYLFAYEPTFWGV